MNPAYTAWRSLFVLVAAVAATSACAQTDELLKVRMQAAVPDTGPAAREQAIQQAQIEIVADILKSALASEHFALVKPILDQTARYIRSTQLIQISSADGQLHVEIECYVKRAEILKDAATMLLPRMPVPPTALAIIAQQAADAAPVYDPRAAAPKAISEALKKRGFDIPDTDLLQSCHTTEEIIAAIQADNDTAARFAREHFADAIILGLATIQTTTQSDAASFVTSSVKIVLRVFRASDGQYIDDLSAEAQIHGEDPQSGAEAAMQDACARIAPAVEVAAAIAIGGTRPSEDVLITIPDPGEEERISQLLKAAAAFIGQDPQLLLYTPTLARLRLPYDGAMTPLLNALTEQKYDGHALETRKAIQRNVQMRFLP